MNLAVLSGIGFLVGIAGGMFGVGGGIVLIPALTAAFGPSQHLYQATSIIVNLFVAVPAVTQHHRAKAIDVRTVKKILPLAAAGAMVGVGASELPIFAGEREIYLTGLFGAFLAFCGGYDVYRAIRRRTGPTLPPSVSAPAETPSVRQLAAVAIPTGMASGLLGIGGGILAVPLQQRFLKLPIRTAIANSAAIIIATSLIGAIIKNYAFLKENPGNRDPFVLAAVLVPTAIAGSLIGSRLTHKLPPSWIKGVFVVLLLASAAQVIYEAGKGIPW